MKDMKWQVGDYVLVDVPDDQVDTFVQGCGFVPHSVAMGYIGKVCRISDVSGPHLCLEHPDLLDGYYVPIGKWYKPATPPAVSAKGSSRPSDSMIRVGDMRIRPSCVAAYMADGDGLLVVFRTGYSIRPRFDVLDGYTAIERLDAYLELGE